jgi:hypothetical protein
MLAMMSTSLLFFYRVRAVYSNSMIVTGVFGFLWASTAGLSVLAPISLFGSVCLSASSISSQKRFTHHLIPLSVVGYI